MTRRLLAAVLAAFALLLAACGGSGSDSADDATSAPTITTQPASLSVAEGGSATFSVVASGDGTLAYQWRKGGASIAGATSASLGLTGVSTSDAGSYDVVVSNSAGSVTSSAATLTVTTSSGDSTPTITTQPVSQSVAVGASVSFSVVASGSGTLSYQWSKDGTAISGATAASHAIASVASSDAGSYTVTVSNSAGSLTSSAAVLTVTNTGSSSHTTATVAAAQSFYAALDSTLQSTAQASWSLSTARRWSNLPAAMVSRNGVAWADLGSGQKTAARSLILTALGSTGNAQHLGLQQADNYLYSIGGGSSYGEGQYHIAFLGTPSTTGFWLLQLTGHHLTYNLAFNGTYASPTPVFMGVEPKASFTYGGTTYDPMQAQREAWSALGAVLTGYSGALLSGTYSDLLFGANGSGNIDGTCPRAYSGVTSHGLAYSSLSSSHQALARAVIESYVATQADEVASALRTAYLSDSALAQTYVAYSGTGTVTTRGNYFRIEGPRVWIELSVQNGVIVQNDIHYHGVWRDKLADYGGQCL